MKLENSGELGEHVTIKSILLKNVVRPKKDTIKISGIYKIVNTIDGKFYLGSSKDVIFRWYRHYRRLIQNRHHSVFLQRTWNKYTKESFVCQVLEEVRLENLLDREQFYLDTLMPWNPTIGYNLNKIASGGDFLTYHPRRNDIIESIAKHSRGCNNPMYGKHHSDDTKKLIADRSMKIGRCNGRWIEVDDITKEKILAEAKCVGVNASVRLGKQLGVGWRVVHRLLGKSY